MRQAVSLWKAVQTATWREDQATSSAVSVENEGAAPYRTFIEEHRPQLRFHYRAIDHLLQQLIIEEASWDAFFEHSGIKPILVLYENFAGDYETSTLNLLERLDLSPPDDFNFKPRMKKQSDSVNDDWTKRYSELRLGTEFDLVPVQSRQGVTPCKFSVTALANGGLAVLRSAYASALWEREADRTGSRGEIDRPRDRRWTTALPSHAGEARADFRLLLGVSSRCSWR